VANSHSSLVLPSLFPAPIFGLRKIAALYDELREQPGELPEKLLHHLHVTHRTAGRDLNHIPKKGPAVLVVNHPFGILEGAVLTAILRQRRGDFKFLANRLLNAIPELRDLLIPVDPMGGRPATESNPAGVRKAIEYLRDGGMLVIFPAGEVSHFQWKTMAIADPPWNPAAARILAIAARRAGSVPVVPAFVEGRNSFLFQAAGVIHPRLRTALLARELLNKQRAEVEVRIGSPVSSDTLLGMRDDKERIDYLRWRTYLLASRASYKPRTALPLLGKGKTTAAEPVISPVAKELLAEEVRNLPPEAALAASGGLTVYLTPAQAIPSLLREIGRLREVTFRAVGEGTGTACDLDRFDPHYLHLFVWNERKQEVAGAYRLCRADKVAVNDLYTATLFRYDRKFIDGLGPALELGRSFLRAEYQKGFSPLLLLWRGIGAYVARNPQCKVLFGPVSISNQYQTISRNLIASFLLRKGMATDLPFSAALGVEDLSSIISDIEPSQPGIPVLLRQYLKLGGKLLAFKVDPNFSNVLDGLILVNLTETEPRLLERYLGKAEADAFLEYQKGTYAPQ
jgi:putative hemolysin